MSLEIDKIKALIAKKNQKDYDYASGHVSVDDGLDVIDNTHKFNAMSVTEKMMYPAKLTRLVHKGYLLSVMVFGSAGIGKTYGVMKELEDSGRTWVKTEEETSSMTEADMDSLLDQPNPTLIKISGNITPKGLYKLFYRHRHGFILVFDDCDDVLLNKIMANQLKAALDSGVEERVITWETSRPEEGLPNSFVFKSQVIFISNMTADKVDKAVRSRSADINLVLTPDEAYEHIGNVLPFINNTRLINGDPVKIDLPEKTNRGIFEKISERRHELPEYSFRTFKMAQSLYSFCEEEGEPEGAWFDLWDHQQDKISQ